MALCGAPSADPGSGPQDGFQPPDGLEEGWYARIETDKGLIIARLLPDQAPQSVAHFVGLAEGTLVWPDPITGEPRKSNYYDGISVDLAQAGERFEAGGLDGDPGLKPPRLFVSPVEGKGPVTFSAAGRMGMTRESGERISAVKFFVTAAALPHLNGPHPCFGEVVEGREVVFTISQVKTHGNGRPIEPVTIDKIRIFSIDSPDPLPEPVAYRPTLKKFQKKK
jgi:peptidyl-prolyl cis-trans isomerase A (cyclophilin A)